MKGVLMKMKKQSLRKGIGSDMKNVLKSHKGITLKKDENVELKQEKGITLIALVITIIVLLILAGVVIATLSGENGILNRASQASENTQRSALIEQAQIAVLEAQAHANGTAEESAIRTALAPYFSNASTVDLTDGTAVLTPIQNTAGNWADITVADVMKVETAETPGGGSTPSATYNALEEGEHVYFKDASNNYVECIVLYDKDSEYGVQIITADTVGDNIELGNGTGSSSSTTDATLFQTAKTSYNNAIGTLNTAAETYRAANASSIASTARCVGSNPANPSDPSLEEIAYTDSTNAYMTTYNWNGIFKSGDHNVNKAINTETDATDRGDLAQMKKININCHNIGKDYWLASRCVNVYSNNTSFYVRVVSSDGRLGSHVLCDVGGNTLSSSRAIGLRPILILNSNIQEIGQYNDKKVLGVE